MLSDSRFIIFSIATSESEIINPLPINLLLFNAKRTNKDQAEITWQVADYYSGGVKFEIERSADNNEFKVIQVLSGNPANKSYYATDNSVQAGMIKYRLKL